MSYFKDYILPLSATDTVDMVYVRYMNTLCKQCFSTDEGHADQPATLKTENARVKIQCYTIIQKEQYIILRKYNMKIYLTKN